MLVAFLIYALIGWLVYGLCFIYLLMNGTSLSDIIPDFNWNITKWMFALFMWMIITFSWPFGLAFGILWYFDELKG